jgi:type II secretory pathway pseudopilin PulG
LIEIKHGAPAFTLVEVSVVSLIFLVIAGALLTTFLAGRSSFFSADAYVQVQQEARRAFDVMVRELREARVSATTPITVVPNGSRQLNFQIALGYDQPACPGAICWGTEGAETWLHYSIVPGPSNDLRLVRCRNNNETGAVTAYTQGTCRVLANYVKHPNDSSSDAFSVAGDVVTMNVQIEYSHPVLPGGTLKARLLTSRVKLRNT